MTTSEKILLWEEEAPFSQQCADQMQPTLTAFPVQGSRGAILICQGGAYLRKALHEGEPIARMLNSEGISAFVLDYRVAPCPYAAPLTDAKRALRTLRAMGYQKVGILGFSAGGNLCCTAATHYDAGDPDNSDPIERFSSRPDAFVPCYAVASFCRYPNMESRKALLGNKADDEMLIHFFSTEENVTNDTPPAFIWHTSDDKAVPVQNSLNLAAALAEYHIPFEMHIYPNGTHGLGLASEHALITTWGNACCRWLLKMGFGI